jgi:hypothetical protein
MKNLKKIGIVSACGAAVWGLSYCGTLYPQFALVFSTFAAGVTALCGILTGYQGSK